MKFSPNKIKEYREVRDLTQEELMIELANAGHKVSRPTIAGWELGTSEPSANDLAKLSIVLGTPIRNFFAHETKQNT